MVPQGYKKEVLIQTVDACNAQCYRCPNKFIYNTNKEMQDQVFLKILEELKKYYGDKLYLQLFLQNEPLLDSKLFKRIEFIKRIFPKSMISIHTNCLLLPKVKNKVIKLFDSKRMHFVMSLQGWDADSYNSIHGTKISQNYFHSMKEEVDCLNKILPSSFKEELPEEKIDEKYLLKHFRWSRGGFLSGDKQLHSKVNGCGGERDQSLNFLYDGSMILCCMDYLRETVYGNIKFQSLREVFETNLYKSYMRAVNGKIKTDDDFICKKCEIAK